MSADIGSVQGDGIDVHSRSDDVDVMVVGMRGILIGAENDFLDVLFYGGDIDHGGVAGTAAASLSCKV